MFHTPRFARAAGAVGPPGEPGAPSTAGNGPVFRAYRATSDQTGVAHGTATQVQLNAESFDPEACFDSTTNYRWTPNLEGIYRLSGCITCAIDASGTSGQALIYKNGALHSQGNYNAPIATLGVYLVDDLISMNGTTDYVELWGYITGGATRKFNFGITATYFAGHLVYVL